MNQFWIKETISALAYSKVSKILEDGLRKNTDYSNKELKLRGYLCSNRKYIKFIVS